MGQIVRDFFLSPSLSAHDYADAEGHAILSTGHHYNNASNFPDRKLSNRKFGMGQIAGNFFLI